jgi:hypothetical protein
MHLVVYWIKNTDRQIRLVHHAFILRPCAKRTYKVTQFLFLGLICEIWFESLQGVIYPGQITNLHTKWNRDTRPPARKMWSEVASRRTQAVQHKELCFGPQSIYHASEVRTTETVIELRLKLLEWVPTSREEWRYYKRITCEYSTDRTSDNKQKL